MWVLKCTVVYAMRHARPLQLSRFLKTRSEAQGPSLILTTPAEALPHHYSIPEDMC
jgi:hypothetical protein